jgi:hypothetical protein
MEWGANGEVLDKCLCLQQRRLGTNGEESCKSFRNGDRGGGRVSRAPQIQPITRLAKQISQRINPDGCGAGIKVKSQSLASAGRGQIVLDGKPEPAELFASRPAGRILKSDEV